VEAGRNLIQLLPLLLLLLQLQGHVSLLQGYCTLLLLLLLLLAWLGPCLAAGPFATLGTGICLAAAAGSLLLLLLVLLLLLLVLLLVCPGRGFSSIWVRIKYCNHTVTTCHSNQPLLDSSR
jgi:hypothetical protein